MAHNPAPEQHGYRDAAHWARHAERIQAPHASGPAPNVDGRRGPLQGFGKMWQKTYKTRLEGARVSPTEVVGTLKERLPEISGFGHNTRGQLFRAGAPSRRTPTGTG